MSTISNAEFIATYELFIIGARAVYATTALVFFEHILAFKYEIDFLWKRKWSAATWIFVLNRYILLAHALFLAAPSLPQICSHSRVMNTLNFIASGEFFTLPTHVFGILRTFALLQDHSWRLPVTWTLIALTLTLVTLASYVDFTDTWTYVDDPIFGSSCFGTGYSVPLHIIALVNKITSITNIISALFVLVITLMKTARQAQQASMLGLKTTLSEVMLRDGSLFFIVVLFQDIIGTVFAADELLADGDTGNILVPLLDVLPQLLLSRFIINLRQIDSPGTNTSANQHPSRFSMPNFRMPNMVDVVGNLGEPLDFVEYRMDDGDDTQDADADAREIAELQDPASTSGARAVDVEAADSSGSVGNSVHVGGSAASAGFLDVGDIELEELRLSTVLPV